MKFPIDRVQLATVMKVDRNGIDPAEMDQSCPYIGLEHIYADGSIDRSHTVGSAGLRSTKHQFTKDHILFGKLRPYLRKTVAPDFDGVCSTDIIPLLPTAAVDKRFLLHWLRTNEIVALATDASAGANLPRVSPAALLRFEIPLPPLADQRRIAAVLDMVEALRRDRQVSLELNEKLLRSAFLNMFVKTPDQAGWKRRTVDWMAEDRKGAIRTGPFGSQLLHSEFVDQGIAVLGIDNAVKNRFEWAQQRFITATKYDELRRYKVFAGDLIITIMGTLGRCAVVPDGIPDAINTKHLCCITLDRRKCLPEFLHACFLYHPDVLRQLGVRAKGAVMPGLNMGIIKSVEIPVPPIELQQQFGQFSAALSACRIDAEESQQEMERLWGAIQQKAFRGELDLSRIILGLENTSPAPGIKKASLQPEPKPAKISLVAPEAIGGTLKKLDDDLKEKDSIPWSPDYFKYRILGVQPVPFTFEDVMQQAATVFEEAPYEEIKDILFDLLGKGGSPALLSQSFELEADGGDHGDGRKGIVFLPAT